ncbi:PDR/VanB family oxidoreductase [Chachezhania sediminis]|uniref:PDR/VanB family oxidoreductase n=1 Tax=Chachezhania sediminis TaxID=2599291 RepID=UPI00131C989E|nr:PDR/VanB family oxidoreductase [Chachezhania sediminis]
MPKPIHRVSAVIRTLTDLPGDIRLIELADRDDWDLPPFTAGAHIDLHLPSGRIRQYSLVGDPAVSNRYVIAVARDEAGRGGSREVHDGLAVGDEVMLSLPRNHFPMADEGRVVMVAGGIGLTPFLSMLPALLAEGRDFALHVCNGSVARHGLADLLDGVPPDRLHLHFSDAGTRLDLAELVATLGPDDHLYVCGPERMLDAAQAAGEGLGDRLHMERFGAAILAGQTAYEVELARSGEVIRVGAAQTMLEALREAGVEVPSSCEAGVCLDCKTRYLSGTPVHRDLIMPQGERGEFLTPCVSGCASERIVLDLPLP